MNKTLEDFARLKLKEGLALLPENNQMIFKRMYSHKNLSKDINLVIDEMESNLLDWALTQVERTSGKKK